MEGFRAQGLRFRRLGLSSGRCRVEHQEFFGAVFSELHAEFSELLVYCECTLLPV